MPEIPLYVVDRKEELRKLGPGGDVLTCFRIWATAKDGTYFHVDVPEEELADARKALEKRARELIAV